MDRIGEIGLMITSAALTCAVGMALAPKKALSKTVKIVCALVFSITAITLIIGMVRGIEFSSNNSLFSSDDISAANIENSISTSLETAAAEFGATSARITTSVNISDSGGIYIDRVEILIDEEDGKYSEIISGYVSECVGTKPQITIRNNGNE